MELKDITNLAKSLSATLNNRQTHISIDGSDIEITVRAERKDITELDKELYIANHGNLDGFESGDDVIVNILGLTFIVSEKNTTENR